MAVASRFLGVSSRLVRAAAAAVVISAMTFPAATGCEGRRNEHRVVAASIPPVAALAEMVTGDMVPVVSLLPPGRSPHDFEPSPSEGKRLRGAILFLSVGGDLDRWMERAVRAMASRRVPRVSLREAAPSADRDPHLWLDLDVVEAFLPMLAESLAARDPNHAEQYRLRAQAGLDSLKVFDQWAVAMLAPVRNMPFALVHPAFASFVRRYGLRLVGVLQTQPEGEPLPRSLGETVARLRKQGAKIVFAEPQINPGVARAVAEEIGGRVAMLDPLGVSDGAVRTAYLDLLRRNVTVLAEALHARAGRGSEE